MQTEQASAHLESEDAGTYAQTSAYRGTYELYASRTYTENIQKNGHRVKISEQGNGKEPALASCGCRQ